MVPTAPAIATTIHDALGIRFNDLPLSAEKTFLALQEQRQKESSVSPSVEAIAARQARNSAFGVAGFVRLRKCRRWVIIRAAIRN
jgi:hypothetical protein